MWRARRVVSPPMLPLRVPAKWERGVDSADATRPPRLSTEPRPPVHLAHPCPQPSLYYFHDIHATAPRARMRENEDGNDHEQGAPSLSLPSAFQGFKAALDAESRRVSARQAYCKFSLVLHIFSLSPKSILLID